MKVMLFFPPHWEPMMPHLALPTLTGYLRSHGVDVIQHDLNAQVFDQVLSGRHLRATLNQVRREGKRLERRGLEEKVLRASAQLVEWAQQEGKRIGAGVDWAKDVIRSDQFYEPEPSRRAFFALIDALMLGSAPFFPSELHLNGYHSAYRPDDSRSILAAVQDRNLNLFRNLFQVSVLPQIRRQEPDVVGISVTCADQIIASFTLASLIREADLPVHIVFGGKMITAWREQLPRAESLWTLFDSAIVFEGERALLHLLEALDRQKGLSEVPNLIYSNERGIHVNELQASEPPYDLPPPDFGGLALDDYLAATRVLPISASRGCYWGRCAFCNVGYGESKCFNERDAGQVADEMAALSENHGAQHFFFADEALTPRMLKFLSRQLIESGASYDWTCCARFEPGIDGPLLRQMRQAGCRMVLYGLESGSQRVLDRMHKGTRLDTARRILQEGQEAGIWNHIFFFFGFPGETVQNAQETIDFVYNNRDVVHSVCSGTFLLERYARVAQDPARYGVSRLIPPRSRDGRERDLGYYYDYEVSEGVTEQQATQIEAQFVESLPDKANPQYYFHDVYRFLYACRFAPAEPFPTMI